MDAHDKDSDARPGQNEPDGPDRPDGEADAEETGGPAGAAETGGSAGAVVARGSASSPVRAAVASGAAGTDGAAEAPEEAAGAVEEAGAAAAGAVGAGSGGTGAVPSARRPEARTGVAALSPRYQIGAVVALAVVAVAVCAHLGLVFLHVAPSNTLTKQHGAAVDEWVFPEFEQNWKLFAPNPLQQNVSVQVRAEIGTADGGIRTTGWYDLSAEDGRDIDGNPLPSHTQQNELRRAWDFFVATHDSEDRPVGLRGSLSETYLRRIALLRLDRNDAAGPGGVVERVQYRSRTTNVKPPSWSGEKVSARPVVRELPWWSVSPETADTADTSAGKAGSTGKAGRAGKAGSTGKEGGAA
ncbi:hypothetical protein B9W64_18030 [Streptomyces sp. CS159]|uniref:DUF5819 family protein n=1 Tax=Streptomyces sp. CS159 TaxID=1982762 RepID=UPI000B41385E|nr:DUF5819 family protein [Streptomyces sp. CS159]OWA14006.1 hypothetical protein B9W64_18030 [Streptomyces sp. CS159]